MTNLWLPAAVLFVILLVLFVREWWRATIVRKSMSLSDEMIRLLTVREVTWLHGGLTLYLATPEGSTLAKDPRVLNRLALFELIQQERQDSLGRSQHARALRAVGLTAGTEGQ